MANVYSWEITQLDCHPQMDDRSNVVWRIGWARTVTDGNVSICVGGSTNIEIEITSAFTEFENLSEAQTINWLENALGAEMLTELDELLGNRLEDRLNPKTVSLSLPWK